MERERDELGDQLADKNLEIENLRSQLSQLSQVPAANQTPGLLDLPEASDLLNRLKAKRKTSKATLADVEAVLELLPTAEPTTPDLYAARDKLFEIPSQGGWKFEKGEKRERFYAFAEALIAEVVMLDPNYTIIQRLQSDLEQEKRRADVHFAGRLEESGKRDKLEKRLGLKPLD